MCGKRQLIDKKQTIVVLEDDDVMLDFLQKVLERFVECDVYFFNEPSKQFCNFIEETPVDLFIMDIRLKNSKKNGIQVSEDIIYKRRGSIFLFMSGYDYTPSAFSSLKGQCVYDFLPKPIDVDEFLVIVSTLLNVASSYKVSFKNTRIKPREADMDSFRKEYYDLLRQDREQIKQLKSMGIGQSATC